jgi:hypothetical protein
MTSAEAKNVDLSALSASPLGKIAAKPKSSIARIAVASANARAEKKHHT